MRKRTETVLLRVLLIATLATSHLFLIAGGQHLMISPSGTQIKNVDSGVIFTCSLIGYKTTSAETPVLRWIGPNRRYINDTKGRVYLERNDRLSLRLYITRIQDTDAGHYTCEATIGSRTLVEETRMFLYEDIKFTDTPTFVQAVIGTSPLLECRVTGQPEPEISWRFNSRKISHDNYKYRYEDGGLLISRLDLRDNGTYECRAEVASHGNLKVRRITVDVLYAPVILRELPSKLRVVKDKTTELTCEADGNPSILYEWFKEQKMSETIRVKVKLNAAGHKYSIRKADIDDEGRYFCRATNSLGFKETSVDLALIVPPRVGELPLKTVVEGRTLVLPCEASGYPQPDITWRKAENTREYSNSGQEQESRISVDITHSGVNKLVIQDIQRTDSGNYVCSAANEGGIHSQNATIIVEFLPKVNVTGGPVQMGWAGHTCSFSCVGHGLPVPTMTWLRNSENIVDSDVFRVTTTRTDVVTSILEIKIPEKQQSFYGTYSCVAKNPHGYFMESMFLQEAQTPDLPSNVSVVDETSMSVVIMAEHPRRNGGMPINQWKVTYEQPGLTLLEPVSLIFDDSRNITVDNLKPGTTYTFYLSAGSDVGFGKPVKFRVRTQRKIQFKEQADVPRNGFDFDGKNSSSDAHRPTQSKKSDSTHPDGTEENEIPSGNSIDGRPFAAADGSFQGLFLAIAAGVAIVVVATVLAVVCFVCVRRKEQTTTMTSKEKRGNASSKNKHKMAAKEQSIGSLRTEMGILEQFTTEERKPGMGGSSGTSSLTKGGPTSSRKNSQVCYVSPTPHRACAAAQSTPQTTPLLGQKMMMTSAGQNGGGCSTSDSLQRRAWEMMIQKQGLTAAAATAGLCGAVIDANRPVSVSELPPPPAFLLEGSGRIVSGAQDGYRSADSVDDDIDDIDYTIRIPSFSCQLQGY